VNRTWSKLGGQLGLGCMAAGVVLIALAWNGAAGVDFVSGQIPYLLSGGALGLALVGVGVALVVVQNSRRDRAILESQLRELAAAVNRLANAVGTTATNGQPRRAGRGPADDVVLIGRGSYHRPECRLVEGKDLEASTPAAAAAEGLSPCRICQPAQPDVEAYAPPR
jgi:hypothetical protein